MSAARDQPMDSAGLRRFGLVTGALFMALFAGLPWLRHKGLHSWPFVVGGPLVVAALLAPAVLAPVQRVWMRLGHALGWVNTRVILVIVFALIVTPIGVVMRLFGRDPLDRALLRGRPGSYRKPSVALDRDRMLRPF